MNDTSRIIVAFDDPTESDFKKISYGLQNIVYGYSVNHNILYYGISMIDRLTRYENKALLDFKLHDDPNIISSVLNKFLNHANIISIHMSSLFNPNNKLISDRLVAITTIPSFDDENCVDIYGNDKDDASFELFEYAVEYKYGYVLCSGKDIENYELVKAAKNNNIKIICDDIRIDSPKHKYNKTPKEAISLGADFIILRNDFMKMIDSPRKVSDVIMDINSI